ncbi:hypothetical protein ACFVWR_15485 [Leifsonia sp. NPDC058292]|uniref:hypothetical protein n=1 Tax=Leifsonia sp. NPDC058292 TaxID=3346428 RepID=UPI0036DAEA86
MAAICEACGGRTEEVTNPYFGKALAVHEHVIMCSQCGHVRFEERDVVRAPAVAVKREGPLLRFWHWFAHQS